MKTLSKSLVTTLIVVGSNQYSYSAVASETEVVNATRPRLVVLTDIGADPDDQMSLVRFLLYANDYDIEGIVATTSTWLRDTVNPHYITERIDAYGEVLPNLRAHANGYADAAALLSRVGSGRAEYGMTGVGAGKDSEGSQLIIDAVDKADARPVWVAIWGGANTLAQSLWKVSETRSQEEVDRFVSRLRVYSISDQDDSGPWLRAEYPRLWWVASVHAFNAYPQAAWLGIHVPAPTSDSAKSSQSWLDANIRKGPMGELYPEIAFGMEGDSPSFMNLISNGLSFPEHPDWGGWGGRYGQVSETYGLWADVFDTVMGVDGQTVRSNQATIWRWRGAYQNDFAARIAWTLDADFAAANHNPDVVLNGVEGKSAVEISTCSGDGVELSAEGTSDPDGDPLVYRWWHYADVQGGFVTDSIEFSSESSAKTTATVPREKPRYSVGGAERIFHVILEVTDHGSPPLTSYRRAVITAPADPDQCTAPALAQ